MEVPSHQAFHAPRGGSWHPGQKGRFQNGGAVRSAQVTEPEPPAESWELRPGMCAVDVTAQLWASGSMEHTRRHATMSSDTLLFIFCGAHSAQGSQAQRPWREA